MTNPFDLSGRVALVTGANKGLGQALAVALAQAGADIAAVGTTMPTETEAQVTALGRRFHYARADLSSIAPIADVVAEVEEALGGLDILVNNAGTGARVSSVELDLADWDRVVALNLDAAFHCAREAAKHMLARRTGAIVNVASIMGLVGNGLYANAAYHATKGALVNLTRALAIEWAPHVRVNAVAPTFVRTALVEKLLALPNMERDLLAATPLGRLAEPAEVAAGILYLVSDEAAMVTGHTLAIDGGWTAR